MKTVILAGGLGTRLSEYTNKIPKPMVHVYKIPILFHIIAIYQKNGLDDFVIAAGYKFEYIQKIFCQYATKIKKNKNAVQIDFYYSCNLFDIKCKVKIVNTGLNTMTGGRIKKILRYIDTENFCLTYGDGVSNVDIKKLIVFHLKHKKIAPLTAVRPPVRFGELILKKDSVIVFQD